jgi:hypothetical protein
VLETLRFKVIDLSMYEKDPNELLLGQVSILIGISSFLYKSFETRLNYF